MANNHETLTGLFTDIADAIRVKTGGTDTIVADEFPEAIATIDTQENLDPELATQDTLIAQIAAALEGKAGVSGGASVETCVVTIGNIYSRENDVKVNYMALENGTIKAKSVSDNENSFELTDVIKGSLLTITTNGSNTVVFVILEGEAEVLWQLDGYRPAGCVLVNGDCRFNVNPD